MSLPPLPVNRQHNISFVLPVFNEIDNIGEAIRRITALAARICEDYEIVIADDASVDGSGELADSLAARDPHIKSIRLKVNSKFGGALKAGLRNASKDVVVYTDCDLPVGEGDMERALGFLADNDFITAYSLEFKHRTVKRFVISRVYNFLARSLFNLKIRDVNSGFKIYRRKVLDGLCFLSESPFVDVEIFAEAADRGIKIKQLGLVFSARAKGKSTISRIGVLAVTFWHMVCYKASRIRRSYAARAMQRENARPVSRFPRAGVMVPLLVAAATLIVFSGVLQNKFLNLDDEKLFLTNPYYRGLGWTNLRWMVTPGLWENYEPLSWLLFGITHAVWGVNPFGYHLVSVLLHAAVAAVLYGTMVCLLKLAAKDRGSGRIAALRWSAGIAALFFSLHPLRVEVVAWASAQHHLLACLFFLASIWAYLKSISSRGNRETHRRWFSASLVSYALSLLSYPIGVTLPAVLLLLDAYLPGDSDDSAGAFKLRASLREKLPFFIVAVAGCIPAVWARAAYGNIAPLSEYGVTDRFLTTLFGLSYYVWKTLIPSGLFVCYPMPDKIDSFALPFILSGLGAALITAIVIAGRRRWPAGLAVWTYYVLTLLPVLGFIQSGSQIAADRYTYIPSFGLAALAAGALVWFWGEGGFRAWRNAVLVAAALLAGSTCLTWRQVKFWHDSESIWRRTLAIKPDIAFAHYNLGLALAAQGRKDEAVVQYNLAIRAQPDYAPAHNNLGNVLAAQDKKDEAISEYKLALKAKPDYADAHYNLALALGGRGKADLAIMHYRLALKAQPDYALAHNNLANALAAQGRNAEAIVHYELALRARPDLAEAHYNMANALAGLGRLDEAVAHYKLTIKARPDMAEAYCNLANALARQGKSEAAPYYRQALRLNPRYGQARRNLEIILRLHGAHEGAI